MMNIVGIDEVGRGSIAGPVAVGIFVIKKKFKHPLFAKFKDSKKLSAQNRRRQYEIFQDWKKLGYVDYCVEFRSAKFIDKWGIEKAVSACIASGLKKSGTAPRGRVVLDGRLRADKSFTNQTAIIKGDEKIPAIAFASIVAKVKRDELMTKLRASHPKFSFAEHKGYGTRKHYDEMEKHGLTSFHRTTFIHSKKAV